PQDADALLELATGTGPLEPDLRHLAAQFEGAWPYLELIARCHHLPDPLDRRVVEAYWVGNRLLAQVPPRALWQSLDDRFRRRAGGRFESLVAPVPLGGVPHHSFHVFAVYPWLGLLRAGVEDPALTVLDRCRIRPATVECVAGDIVVVRNRVLAFDGSRLVLGEEVREQVRRSLDGLGFVPGLAPGDIVSVHWDWICERLEPDQASSLRRWTARNLDAVNASPLRWCA
ncbi:MAG TPA: DUF6390 family protein, partial [Acidimicrobiales bacterium]|nr:DUF6390 family protein [Acidimicrobiales bacterium]